MEELKKILAQWFEEGYSEGGLSVDPEWYVLWEPGEIEQANKDLELDQFTSGYTAFGGNGGGELLVVNEAGEVFVMPAIGMEPSAAIKVAASLDEFKGYMEKG